MLCPCITITSVVSKCAMSSDSFYNEFLVNIHIWVGHINEHSFKPLGHPFWVGWILGKMHKKQLWLFQNELCPVVFSKCAMSMPKIKLGSFKMCYVHGQNVQNVLCPYLRYRNSGSFKTCYVHFESLGVLKYYHMSVPWGMLYIGIHFQQYISTFHITFSITR